MANTLILLALMVPAVVVADTDLIAAQANPIRKVVTMLQGMQKKVEAEGKTEKELFDKFMCYCKSSGGALGDSISAAETKVPRLGSDIEEAVEQKAQTEEALKQAQIDRDAANAAMAEASSIRNKEAADFAKESSELSTNIAAITKAVAALEKGMAGAFLQSSTAQTLKDLLKARADMVDSDRSDLLAFLSGTQGTDYAPASGEITGILKTLNDEMSKSLADSTTAENGAIASYGELMAAKKKEVAALQKSIETKTMKVGELGVSIVQMKNDLSDTQEALLEDQKFLGDMEKDCKTRGGEYDEHVKTRNEELRALADTIKILNDDDALEMFKKTLPGASSSFVQVGKNAVAVQKKALALIEKAREGSPHRANFDFIALALHGKKIGFEKVIKMVDEMVATLKQEQLDDNHKKEYCDAQFDMADDKKKALERSVSDEESAIASAQENIATTKEEIAALEAGIKGLDKSVAEATEQRQEENAEYKELMASNGAAKEILGFAKNRLNKFYNPKLYKAPASFLQISASKDAPPPAPETGDYSKKSGESTGVIAMIDLLVKDLEKEMTEAATGEKDAQGDYETAMKDSAEKRTQDSKSLTEKNAAKADSESSLETHTEGKASAVKELGATNGYIASLHAECDWLIQYFDVRTEARTGEIDSLVKAKAVLSGADFSLVEKKSSLRRQL